jgi:hypothetical protein
LQYTIIITKKARPRMRVHPEAGLIFLLQALLGLSGIQMMELI